MEYLIAYDPSADTFTVEDVFPKRTLTDRGSPLPTNALPRIYTPPHHYLSKPNTVLPSFIRLPLEIRLVIYTHCLATPLPYSYDIHNLGHQLTLDLLLVNHQIYDEARLIPFQQNVFNFDKWNGTGLFYCQSFLRYLQFWQRASIRNIRLNVLGVTLICETGVGRWLDLCGELAGCSGRKDEGLKTLQLTISGCITNWKSTFDLNAPWVAHGLLKLHSLQTLEVTAVTEGVNFDLLTEFIGDVQSRLHEVKITLKTLAKGKQSIVYFPVSLEGSRQT
ncbi:hypothetical protein H2202_006185 [Exophiala xenobiotica]|nr:hypothetical protein H2202_006185 [Exophiala xenobiotica]